jgi:hypothetical protein
VTFQRIIVPAPSEAGSSSPLLELLNLEGQRTAILQNIENPTTHHNIMEELILHANKPLASMTISNLE